MGIQKLGHVGIYAQDFEKLRDFYSRVVGLTIADEAANACFMSSDPDREHHEFVIFRASGPEQKSCVQQISFSCEKLEDIVEYYHRFKDNDVRFRSVTSHGNAWSCYFKDPEGNTVEAYLDTPFHVPQPHGEPLDLTKSDDEILRETEASCRADPGFMMMDAFQKSLANRLAG